MLNISMQFIAGGFHATPWGRHVNEGATEWPPSQWRFLRALISVWHIKFKDEILRDEISELVNKLASELPEYHLPDASSKGSRHYMPGHAHKEGEKIDVSLILDTAVALGKKEKVNYFWSNLSLTEAEESVLKKLVGGLSYFGRAESWVLASIESSIPLINCSLVEFAESEKILSSCCYSSDEFSAWKRKALEEIEEVRFSVKKQKDFEKGKAISKTKFSKKERDKAITEIPETLLDALEVKTSDIRNSGWSIAPALKQVVYYRRKNCFDTKPTLKHGVHKSTKAVRYAVSSAVLPKLTDSISVGARVRTALMSIAGKQNDGEVPQVFSGKSKDGIRLDANHQHAYFLSESCYGGGRISHVTVFSRDGFNREATRALLSVRRVWGREGHDLQLIPAELGSPETLGGERIEKGKSPIMASATDWESVTPFYPTRHPKPKAVHKQSTLSWYNFMKQYYINEVLRELKHSNLPEPEIVEILPVNGIMLDGHLTSFLKFNTRRKGNGKKANIAPVAVKLQFKESVQGPIVIGYSSHFGLGLFKPL